MNTTAIYFTDLHLNEYKQFSNGRDRLEDGLKVIDDVFKYAIKNEIEVILFGGDMMDVPKHVYTVVWNRLMQRLAKWFTKAPQIKMYAISGNHDYATKNLIDSPAESSLTSIAIAFPKNFIILDNNIVCLTTEVAIAGIPYYEYKEHYSEVLARMAVEGLAGYMHINDRIKVTLMIHQTPTGLPNPNIKADTDFTNPVYTEFEMILCGHIHQQQRLSPKFLLGGNPLHRDLGDIGQVKGFWRLDLADPQNTIRFISREGRYPEFKRVKVGTEIAEDDVDFIVTYADKEDTKFEGAVSTKDFGADLSQATLLTNFWKTKDGKDKELLAIGLELLNQ